MALNMKMIFLLSIALFASADGLRCYVCDGTVPGSDCGDSEFDPDNAVIETCDSDTKICAKIAVGKLAIRRCDEPNAAVGRSGCFDVGDEHLCACTTDLCNSALTLGLDAKIVVLITAIIFATKYY